MRWWISMTLANECLSYEQSRNQMGFRHAQRRTRPANRPWRGGIGVEQRHGRGLSASHPQLKMARIARQWKAHREIDERDETIDREWLEGRVVDGVRGPHQFLEADDRGDGRHLHELHQETHHRSARDRKSLWQDHEAHLLDVMEADALGGIPLAERNGLDAAAPDLGKEGTGAERQADNGGGPGLDAHPDERQPEEYEKELHQERRALEQADVELCEPSEPAPRGDARQQNAETD